MSFAYGNRVWQTTTTTGAGNLSLDPVNAPRWRSFADEIAAEGGDYISYLIEVDGTGQWEFGAAQILPGSPDQLVRYFVEQNSDGTNIPLILSAGTHQVTSPMGKSWFRQVDIANRNLLSGGAFIYSAALGFEILPGVCSIGGFRFTWESTINGPGTGGYTPNTLYHVYLYSPTPEDSIPLYEVTTVGSVISLKYGYWHKIGDDGRRLIGWFRADSNGNVHSFVAIRNGSELTIFYDITTENEIWLGQSEAAWSRITSLDQFAPVGSFNIGFAVEMIFGNQNNANKIGIHPIDLGLSSVESGLYRQAFNANKDTAIIADSYRLLPLVKSAPELWTRNENYTGSTPYGITLDSVSVNLIP